jgi:hypothetical protein
VNSPSSLIQMGWEENIQIQINVVLQLCSYQYYLVPGIWGGGGLIKHFHEQWYCHELLSGHSITIHDTNIAFMTELLPWSLEVHCQHLYPTTLIPSSLHDGLQRRARLIF